MKKNILFIAVLFITSTTNLCWGTTSDRTITIKGMKKDGGLKFISTSPNVNIRFNTSETITLQGNINEDYLEVSVTNSKNEEVHSESHLSAPINSLIIPMNLYPKGEYSISITDGSTIINGYFLVE